MLSLLSSFSYLWERFGSLVSFDQAEMKKSNLSNDDKLKIILDTWLVEKERTWDELLDLLKRTSVCEIDHGIALKIFDFDFLTRKNNIQGMMNCKMVL